MRILVTGASGLLGLNFAIEAAKDQVRALEEALESGVAGIESRVTIESADAAWPAWLRMARC